MLLLLLHVLYLSELEGCQDSKKSDLVLEDISGDVILKCVTKYSGIKPVWLQKWSFKISSGQIQNYLSAVPTDCAVVSQIRCNNGCMNRWKSGYSQILLA